MHILLFNILIAMINITYKTVAEKATKEFYKQVKLIYLDRDTH